MVCFPFEADTLSVTPANDLCKLKKKTRRLLLYSNYEQIKETDPRIVAGSIQVQLVYLMQMCMCIDVAKLNYYY